MPRTPILITAVCALGVLFIAFAWWVFLTSDAVPLFMPIALTSLPILAGVVLWVWPRIARHRAARATEAMLREQASAGEGRSAELDRLRDEFEQAIAALKSSRLSATAGQGRDALAVLPWYAIIGPPGCGKTTALRESGLRFPHVKGTGKRPQVKGLGGTRNCDWFLTDEAIILDTAGRWALDESGDEKSEWTSFLRLLRRHRPKKPLNGVIVAVSLAEDLDEGEPATIDDSPSIVGLDERNVVLLAERIRDRLDDISHELGVRLPVYVIFTKCDLLSGFAESFDSMSEKERRQILGFNARVGEASDDPGSFFDVCFDELCGRVERHAMTRIAEEVRPEAQERVLGFPAQLRALRGKLMQYVATLLEDSQYSEAPLLRGVYFTCGVRQGAPAQVQVDEHAAALGLEDAFEVGEATEESYFLHDMLRKVVFKDQNLATASTAELLRRKTVRRIWTSSVLATAALLLVFSATSFSVNSRLLDQTRGALAASERDRRADGLWPLYEHVQVQDQGLPTLWALGFYQGDELRQPLRDRFAEALRDRVLRDLYAENTRLMKDAVSRQERAQLPAALRFHLLLGMRPEDADKAGRCAIPSPITEAAPLTRRALDLWERLPDGRAEEAQRERRSEMLQQYLRTLSPREGEVRAKLTFNTEPAYIAKARAMLGSNDPIEQALSAIRARYAEPVQVSEWLDPVVVDSRVKTMPKAFTYDAWARIEREIQAGTYWEAGSAVDCWLLGPGSASKEAQTSANTKVLEERYLEVYYQAWAQLLNGLSARVPTNLSEASALLKTMAQSPGPLGQLFQRLARETTAPPPPPTEQLKEAAIDKAKEVVNAAVGLDPPKEDGAEPVGGRGGPMRKFQSLARFGVAPEEGGQTGLDVYRSEIVKLVSALEAYALDRSRAPELATAAQATLSSASLLVQSQPGFQAVLGKLLIPPLEAVQSLATEGSNVLLHNALQEAWCQEFYGPFRDQLAGRFPFRQSFGSGASARDIAESGSADLAVVQRLLSPQSGSLWSLLNGALAGYVVREGARYRFGARDGQEGSLVLRHELLQFLRRARKLVDVLFPGESPEPSLRFQLELSGATGVGRTTFMMGGQAVASYDNGATRWVDLQWPGPDPAAGVEVQATSDNGGRLPPVRMPGAFGLWLLSDGSGCYPARSAMCEATGRCERDCRSWGAGAEATRKACGGQACYVGLHQAAVASEGSGERIVRLRDQANNRIKLRNRGGDGVLNTPTLFLLDPPSRIARLATQGCGGD